MSINMVVQSFFLIPLNERLSLRVIDHKAFLDGLLVVISTSTFLSTLDESVHQLVLGHVQLYHSSHLVTTLIKHLLQCLSLWNGAGEAIKDNALVSTSKLVIDFGKNAYH